MEKQNIIISPYSLSIVLAKKKDGMLQICIDYQQLNQITEFDTQPILNQKELLLHLTKTNYYSKFDKSRIY